MIKSCVVLVIFNNLTFNNQPTVSLNWCSNAIPYYTKINSCYVNTSNIVLDLATKIKYTLYYFKQFDYFHIHMDIVILYGSTECKINQIKSNKEMVGSIFFNLAKDFDSVEHSILIKKFPTMV
jgi:hypothetical protein